VSGRSHSASLYREILSESLTEITKQTFEKFFTGKTRLTSKLEIILQNTGPGGPVTAMEVSST